MAIMALTIQYFPGGQDGVATATSGLADPTYRWWLAGELVLTTAANVFYFHVDIGESVQLDVYDDATVPAATFPCRDTFQWEHADGSDYYEILEYVGAAWVVRGITRDIGQWIFRWKSRVLEDCTSHQFRVRSMGIYSTGEYKTFSAYMIRNPDHPQYTPSLDPDTGVLTFA
jgi:hypothetical protein